MQAKQLLLVDGLLYEVKDFKGDEAESCNNCDLKEECDKVAGEFPCDAEPSQNYVKMPMRDVERVKLIDRRC